MHEWHAACAEGSGPASPGTRPRSCGNRLAHLEGELQALQDSVYRDVRRHDQEMADLRQQVDPENLVRRSAKTRDGAACEPPGRPDSLTSCASRLATTAIASPSTGRARSPASRRTRARMRELELAAEKSEARLRAQAPGVTR